MTGKLNIIAGQYSDRGRKPANQDFHGLCLPKEPQLSTKGVAVALADGISTSEVSQIASQAAVTGFLDDYYCTSESWTVRNSALRVLHAINSWLYAQTRQSQFRYDRDKGYVCTFSALVIKSTTAHLFHVGDARIYRLRGESLEQLTEDHRYWVSREQSYLARALGINQQIDIDHRTLPVEAGDIFILATDGVYEYQAPQAIVDTLRRHGNDLDTAAREIVNAALAQDSDDNLTIQIVRVESLPDPDASEIGQRALELPFPPALDARMTFDGFRIIRELHASSRSHAWLAEDTDSGEQVVIKTPSVELRDDPAYLERFLLEEWIARRINNPHVLKPCAVTRKRNFLYVALEYIEGQTLAQWLRDNPRPDLNTVRSFLDQSARGLQAFHRLEMLHQDIRPENIMIDSNGTAKIIDFGSVEVAGLRELAATDEPAPILGTEQYSAPEYFLGEEGSQRSDIFSLGTIAYQMLTGRLPYGTQVPKCRTRAALRKLDYTPISEENRKVPVWVDEAIRRAVHPDPNQRYAEASEFTYDLQHPNPEFARRTRPPLIERHPVAFWKTVSLILAIACLVLIGILAAKH